jgi:hypothetical protein
MSGDRQRTIVWCMLNQLHATADLAADRRRTLLAEADAYRLARTARRARAVAETRPPRPRGLIQVLRVRLGRAPA